MVKKQNPHDIMLLTWQSLYHIQYTHLGSMIRLIKFMLRKHFLYQLF
jgi:hypothetical protein